MEASAEWSTIGARRLLGAAKRKKPREMPAKAGSGSAATVEKTECAIPLIWFLRRQESASAGFCIARRSSVTEMTGNRTRTSTARATR